MKAIPSKSKRYRYAESLFFSNYNDVHFYVEDIDSENFYLEIFQRHFPNIRITKIFPLGGKRLLLEHAKACINKRGHKHIHLADLDFDQLLGCVQKMDGLVYLDRYSIENYLLDSQGFVELLVILHSRKSRASLSKYIRIESWLRLVRRRYARLYVLFLICQLHGLHLENVGMAIERFCAGGKKSIPDRAKIKNYEVKIRNELKAKKPNISFRSEMLALRPLFNAESHVFSGKHLLSIMLDLASKKTGLPINLSNDAIKILLAQKSSLKGFEIISRRICRYINVKPTTQA